MIPNRSIVRFTLAFLLLGAACCWLESASAADETIAKKDDGCAEAVLLLRQQERRFARDLRLIQRELAALRNDMTRPGIPEIICGIGYIFGICGIAFYMAARKQQPSPQKGN